MAEGWRKYAIAGATYARALENAAARGGRALSPAMSDRLIRVRAQGNAQLAPGLGQFFREHGNPMHGGELAPTPQSTAMQQLAHDLPWAGPDHAPTDLRDRKGSLGLARVNQMLDRRGLSSTTPGGQSAFNQQVVQNLPLPPKTRDQTSVGRAPAPDQYNFGGNILDLMMPTRAGKTVAGHGAGAPAQHALPPPPIQRPIPRRQASPTAPMQPQNTASASSMESTRTLPKTAAALPMVAGLGTPLAVGASLLLNKPGIRADLMDRITNPGDTHQKDVAQAIPADVLAQARAAQQALAAKGMDPKALRFAVDAPSGAGKTVLSKALAQEMGLQHHGLDWRPHAGLHQLLGGGDVERMPYTPHAGDVLEHQQLLRSYDPSAFDVAIHINRAPEQIKQQIIQRGRDARMADLLDYDKSIAVGNRSFDTLGGDAVDLGGGVMMKIRPEAGWGDALDQQLAAAGIDGNGLSRHEKLLSLQANQRTTGAGWLPYTRNPFDQDEMNKLRGAAGVGMQAAKSLSGSR
jgi:hypothetical protein